jgi:hypothetical protein
MCLQGFIYLKIPPYRGGGSNSHLEEKMERGRENGGKCKRKRKKAERKRENRKYRKW